MTALVDPAWVAVHAVSQRDRAICVCGHRLTKHVGKCTNRRAGFLFVDGKTVYLFCHCREYAYAGLAPREG